MEYPQQFQTWFARMILLKKIMADVDADSEEDDYATRMFEKNFEN